jgi:hypothetical protein
MTIIAFSDAFLSGLRFRSSHNLVFRQQLALPLCFFNGCELERLEPTHKKITGYDTKVTEFDKWLLTNEQSDPILLLQSPTPTE